MLTGELPFVFSELEKAKIENSISITAYNRTDIRSVGQLILSEYSRLDPTKKMQWKLTVQLKRSNYLLNNKWE